MRLLVTGAGRCGTTTLTEALRQCGLDAGHEQAFSTRRHGTGDWTCEVSWLAAPYTPRTDAHVVHLVRHPLDQIRSRASWGSFDTVPPKGRPGGYDPRRKGLWATVHAPDISQGATTVERAAIHWARWNQLVAGADELLRVEDLTAETVTRLARIVDPTAPALDRLPDPRNASPALLPPLRWEHVAHVDGLVDQAAEYGYPTP